MALKNEKANTNQCLLGIGHWFVKGHH